MSAEEKRQKDQGQSWEETPITQETLDELASLPPEQFQKVIVDQVHQLYLSMAETVQWTADQRDMVGKTLADGTKAIADGLDDRLRTLEHWAFTMTILVNQLRGLPPDAKRDRGTAEMFLVDYDGFLTP
jgi:hypothetical protein